MQLHLLISHLRAVILRRNKDGPFRHPLLKTQKAGLRVGLFFSTPERRAISDASHTIFVLSVTGDACLCRQHLQGGASSKAQQEYHG